MQRVLAEIDPEMQAYDVFAMSERVEKSLNPRRAPMVLSLAFGVVALLLASIGLYGVLAYQVSQRTREIGIRMALGSDTPGILRLVINEGALLVALGLAGGLVGAVVLRGVIASQLYGVGALDPMVMLRGHRRARADLACRVRRPGAARGPSESCRGVVAAVDVNHRDTDTKTHEFSGATHK